MPQRARLAGLLCTLVAGALLGAVLGAYLIFAGLGDDHARAGAIAGELFMNCYWLALVVACGAAPLAAPRSRLVTLLLGAAALFSVIEIAWLVPAIASHGANSVLSFTQLHGLGGAMHLAISAALIAAAWLLMRAPRGLAG